MIQRVWKAIGTDGYEISSLGEVRVSARRVPCGRGFRITKARTLRPFLNKHTGYLHVDIAGARHAVHRLVASAFCKGQFDGAQVNHKNSNRADNRADNLEWVTASENVAHGFSSGRVNPFRGVVSGDHPTAKAVVSECPETGATKRYRSAMDAVREGFDSGSISRCCNGRNKLHKGLAWRYAEEAA